MSYVADSIREGDLVVHVWTGQSFVVLKVLDMIHCKGTKDGSKERRFLPGMLRRIRPASRQEMIDAGCKL